ncbi:MAG: type II toxin-antitoxin system Phd/YefM family antitoxin [Acidimicrobiales bacterium]
MTQVVNVTEAKAQLSRLVDQAASGSPVVIAKAGKPLAVLTSYVGDTTPRRLGAWRGRVKIGTDFDLPLDDDFLTLFEGSRP